MIRRLLMTVLVALVLTSPLKAADRARMSISSIDVSFRTAGVAQKRGFFRDEGSDVELIRMNANISVTGLSTGDIDYAMIFGSG